MWTLALNGTGRHGKFTVIALKCYESVLDGRPILPPIQDGYVRDMRQNHHERHLGSNVESRPPMLPYVVLLMCFFLAFSYLGFPPELWGADSALCLSCCLPMGQGCPCLAQELLQANEVAFFQKHS